MLLTPFIEKNDLNVNIQMLIVAIIFHEINDVVNCDFQCTYIIAVLVTYLVEFSIQIPNNVTNLRCPSLSTGCLWIAHNPSWLLH